MGRAAPDAIVPALCGRWSVTRAVAQVECDVGAEAPLRPVRHEYTRNWVPILTHLGASLLVYGMAGQLVLLQAGGAGVLAAALGATAANARFLPMALAIAPWLGPAGWRRWLALPFIAITPWAAAMRVRSAASAERPTRRTSATARPAGSRTRSKPSVAALTSE